jgi:hypothetical protein
METTDSVAIGDPLAEFYVASLDLFDASRIPFLVGGTFAYARYTAIERETKDLDVFVRPEDLRHTLDVFEVLGYRTEVPYPHWLAKVWHGDHVLDIIFCSGNGVARVDDEWFAHAAESEVLGRRVQLCPLEELIWSKSFVQERERFDGADVMHLLREAGRDLDWARLLARFGEYWPVLLSHLITFCFVYPSHRDTIPERLIEEMSTRLAAQPRHSRERICYGTLLSREQYLHDVQQQGYIDARLEPYGAMSAKEIALWTEAIGKR